MNQPQQKTGLRSRRTLALAGAVLCGIAAGLSWTYSTGSGTSTFGFAVFMRAAIVFALLWLAYPSLQRPLRWCPPVVVVVFLVGLGVMIANPRLVPAVVPLLGIAGTVLGVLTWLRKTSR